MGNVSEKQPTAKLYSEKSQRRIHSETENVINVKPLQSSIHNEDTVSVVPDNTTRIEDVYSLTIPTMFDLGLLSESSHNEDEDVTFALTNEKINTIVNDYVTIHGDDLTEEMMESVDDVLHKYLSILFRNYKEGQKRRMEPAFLRRFVEVMPADEDSIYAKKPHIERIMRHFVAFVHMHKMLLMLYQSNAAAAHDLLKQIAISHALMKVTADDFTLMNHLVISYLLENQALDDGNMPPVVTYFFKFTDYIIALLNYCKNKRGINARSGRNSQPRENYRILKRWKCSVAKVRKETAQYEHIFSGKLNIKHSDTDSLDTLGLKSKDWLMNNIFKNRFKRRDSQPPASTSNSFVM